MFEGLVFRGSKDIFLLFSRYEFFPLFFLFWAAWEDGVERVMAGGGGWERAPRVLWRCSEAETVSLPHQPGRRTRVAGAVVAEVTLLLLLLKRLAGVQVW